MIINRQHFSRSSGLIQSTLVAVGNVGASGFSAISLIILSRFLGPQAFGGFSVAFSLTQLTARLGDAGLSTALLRIVAANREHNQAKAAAAVQLIGKLKLISMLLACVVGWTLGPMLSTTLFHVSDPFLTTMGICFGIVILWYEYMLSIVQAVAKFGISVLMNAVQAVLKCGMAIVGYFTLPPDPRLAYAWYGSAPLIAAIVGWFSVRQFFTKQTKMSVGKDVLHIAKFAAVGVLAAAVGDNVDVLMVNASLTEYQTGLYSAAARIALMLTLFGLSFGTVFNTRVAQYRDKTHLNTFLMKANLFALGSLLLIPIGVLLGKPLLTLTAGSQFLAAMPAMNYLMASSFVMMAAIPFISIFYAVDYPAYFAISGVIQTVVLVGLNAVLIPELGIEGAGLAKLITRLVVAIYTVIAAYHHARRQYQISWPKFGRSRSFIHE